MRNHKEMKKKEWTIMVYLAGDNNLSVDMAYAMEQIKSIAGEEANGTNLFVYYDGNSESIPTLYCDFSDSNNPKHVRSYKVPNKLYRVDQKRNENAADFRSVLNFVDWCLNKVEVRIGDTVKYGRRADRYGLIFSGHSLGFEDPGLFKDETSGKTMSMEHLFLLVDREHVDDAVDRFRAGVGMQGRESQVTGFRNIQRFGNGFEISHFADEHDIGILTQRVLECNGE